MTGETTITAGNGAKLTATLWTVAVEHPNDETFSAALALRAALGRYEMRGLLSVS
jgi:hypothetical protein